MSETEEFWRGDFGDSYLIRNRNVNWAARVPFWQQIIARTHASSVLEVGCNIGANLRAIRKAAPEVETVGIDVNQSAIDEASAAGLTVAVASASDLSSLGKFDLVFSSGVLIHIAPDDLSNVMDNIIAASREYVLAVEYADETEVEVPYRGHEGKLWRRPFGKLYEQKGLKIISSGPAPADAFDNCFFWLFTKGES